MKQLYNNIKFYAEKAFFLIIIIFVSNYVWNNLANFDFTKMNFKYYILFSSFVIIISSYIFQGLIWSRVLNSNSVKRVDIYTHIKIFLYSQFGKYLPGKIASYAILINLYRKEGYSKKEIVVASYYDLISWLIATALFLFTSLLLFKPTFWNIYYDNILYLMIFSLFAAANPKILNILLKKALSLLKREQFQINLRYIDLMKFVILYTLNLFIWGIAFFLLIQSLIPIDISNYFYVAFAFAFSAFLGLISIVAPAGLGVREGALIALLKSILTANVAAMISIVSRIWMVVAEIILFLIILVIDNTKNHTQFGNLIKESKEMESLDDQ